MSVESLLLSTKCYKLLKEILIYTSIKKMSKIFSCDKYTYTSNRKLNVERHQKTHEKAKKTTFKCTQEGCEYSTLIKCNYQKHVATHSSQLYRCNACNIIVKCVETHKQTVHHRMAYASFVRRFRWENIKGKPEYRDKTVEEIIELSYKMFSFEKVTKKKLFTVQKTCRRTGKEQDKEQEENDLEDGIYEDENDAQEIENNMKRIQNIIDNGGASQQSAELFEKYKKTQNTFLKNDQLDKLLVQMEDEYDKMVREKESNLVWTKFF